MNIGDRVGYTRPWLQSVTGGDPTHELWFAKGVVTEVEGKFAFVHWEGETQPRRVAVANIAKLGSFAFAHADAPGWVGYGALGEKARSPWRKESK